jgi:hypothetical protein
MRKNPKWKNWLQWYEVNGGSRTIKDQYRELLRKYNRSSLLVLCAQLSVAFAYGPEGETSANDELTKRLIVWLFPPGLVSKINEFAKQDRIIFFQAQLRYIAAEVIRLGADITEKLPAIENFDVGELLLRASELMYLKHPDQPDPFDQLANRISQFLPIYEIDLPNDPFMLQLRFYIFLTVIIPRLPPEKRIFDIDKLFKDHFGFELTTFRQFMYAFGMHALMMRMDEKPSRGTEDCGLRVSTFKNATVSHEQINAMFATVSFSWENLKGAKETKGYANFDFLKDQPYFLFKEALYCLDYEFGMGKLESSVIWRIVKRTMDKNKGDEYLGFWGYVFEDYVAWLFETYSLPRFNKVYPSPKYIDDPSKEICDTIIICGSTAILIESKLATCASIVRYGGDYAAMRDFLEERLVTTVGVRQLRTAIDNLTSLPAQCLPVWLAGVTKLIPVIITKDDIGSCWYVNKYLNDRFEVDLNRKKYKGISICPLVSMSIASLERCMKELKSRHFSDVLEQRIRANRDMIWTFEMASKYVDRGPARDLPEHVAILHRYSEEMISGLGIHD